MPMTQRLTAFYRWVAKPRDRQPTSRKRWVRPACRQAAQNKRRQAEGKTSASKPRNTSANPYALTSSSTSVVAYAMNEVISSTARRASGLMSKLSWNMCIALSHT